MKKTVIILVGILVAAGAYMWLFSGKNSAEIIENGDFFEQLEGKLHSEGYVLTQAAFSYALAGKMEKSFYYADKALVEYNNPVGCFSVAAYLDGIGDSKSSRMLFAKGLGSIESKPLKGSFSDWAKIVGYASETLSREEAIVLLDKYTDQFIRKKDYVFRRMAAERIISANVKLRNITTESQVEPLYADFSESDKDELTKKTLRRVAFRFARMGDQEKALMILKNIDEAEENSDTDKITIAVELYSGGHKQKASALVGELFGEDEDDANSQMAVVAAENGEIQEAISFLDGIDREEKWSEFGSLAAALEISNRTESLKMLDRAKTYIDFVEDKEEKIEAFSHIAEQMARMGEKNKAQEVAGLAYKEFTGLEQKDRSYEGMAGTLVAVRDFNRAFELAVSEENDEFTETMTFIIMGSRVSGETEVHKKACALITKEKEKIWSRYRGSTKYYGWMVGAGQKDEVLLKLKDLTGKELGNAMAITVNSLIWSGYYDDAIAVIKDNLQNCEDDEVKLRVVFQTALMVFGTNEGVFLPRSRYSSFYSSLLPYKIKEEFTKSERQISEALLSVSIKRKKTQDEKSKESSNQTVPNK